VTAPIPNPLIPISSETGVSQQWYQYFQSLSGAPGAGSSITMGPSPFTYPVPDQGVVMIGGGTVSAVVITRGRDSFSTGLTSGAFPLGKGDVVRVTYSVAPTMTFLPS
jgi:hypothetical protein